MFKTRLQRWGYSKNTKSDDWHALAALYSLRRSQGKRATAFLVHERRKTVKDLRAHVQGVGTSFHSFTEAALGCDIPPHVRAFTPVPRRTTPSSSDTSCNGDATTSPSTRSNGLSLTPGFADSPPTSVPSLLKTSVPSVSGCSPIPEIRMDPSAKVRHQGQTSHDGSSIEDFEWIHGDLRRPSDASLASCGHLQQDVKTMALQVMEPTLLRSRYGADDIQSWLLVDRSTERDASPSSRSSCLTCQEPLENQDMTFRRLQPSTARPRSILSNSDHASMTLPAAMDNNNEPWRFLACCFGACMHMSLGWEERAKALLSEATEHLEAMLRAQDSRTLTALNLMFVILHQHDQGRIARSTVLAAHSAAERVLPLDDPVRNTTHWMLLVANDQLAATGNNGTVVQRLEKVYTGFMASLGQTDATTQTALYNYSWMLLHEEHCVEAEGHLRSLYDLSASTLGPKHMQTIVVLSTLGRALEKQERWEEAISTMQKAIKDCADTLGRNHPYRLESKRRLALVYSDLDRDEEMIELYWQVLEGRIKMLGRQHQYTAAMRRDLVNMLEYTHQWDEAAQRRIDGLFTSTSPPASPYEAF